MPNIKFRPEEDKFLTMQELYNALFDRMYPQILHYSPMKLCELTSYETPDDWKEFLLHPKFREWYKTEEQIFTQTKAMELLQKVGETNSQAQATQMNQLFNRMDKQEERNTNETKIVYNFIDLSQVEKSLPNVRVLDNLPPSIKDAVQVIK